MKLPNVKERKMASELQLAKDLLEYTPSYLCGSYESEDENIQEIVKQITAYLCEEGDEH